MLAWFIFPEVICLCTITIPQLPLPIYLPLTTHTTSSKPKDQSHICVLTCYARWIELCQTLQLFLAGNLSRICTGHQMAFSRKASTASVARLSWSTRIERYPCRRRCLVQQFASEIQEQQHNQVTEDDLQQPCSQKRSSSSSVAWRKSCNN